VYYRLEDLTKVLRELEPLAKSLPASNPAAPAKVVPAVRPTVEPKPLTEPLTTRVATSRQTVVFQKAGQRSKLLNVLKGLWRFCQSHC
jgi:hypothetical protein